MCLYLEIKNSLYCRSHKFLLENQIEVLFFLLETRVKGDLIELSFLLLSWLNHYLEPSNPVYHFQQSTMNEFIEFIKQKTFSPIFYPLESMQMIYLEKDENNVERKRHIVELLFGPQALGTKLLNKIFFIG